MLRSNIAQHHHSALNSMYEDVFTAWNLNNMFLDMYPTLPPQYCKHNTIFLFVGELQIFYMK